MKSSVPIGLVRKHGLSYQSAISNLKKQQKEVIADVLATLDEKEQKNIQDINKALARMEVGEYGSCEVCGKGIEVDRLEAVPWTSVCSKHKRTE
jgi:RNA polymerase-binding transcription factor DksA